MKSKKILYHYTSADALLGILQSGSLWASDIRFLNDSTEFTFARDLLVKALQDKASRLRNKDVRKIVFEQFENIRTAGTVHAYVISLSEQGNMLSQWRAYAPRDGVCIGFLKGALNNIKDFALHRCVYIGESSFLNHRERRYEAIVNELVTTVSWVSRLIQQEARTKQRPQSRRTSQEGHALTIHTAVVNAALRIKHRGFKEEAEWRLIDNTDSLNFIHALEDDPGDQLKFRKGAFGVTPYIVARLPDVYDGLPFGISNVMVGPSANSDSIVASIRELLRIKYNSKAQVEATNIPFRAW
jgi:hypothetical protein